MFGGEHSKWVKVALQSTYSLQSSHPPTLPPSHPLTLSPSHPLTLSPSHPLTLSPSHPLTLSPSHPLTLSPSHPLTLSPSHPPLTITACLSILMIQSVVGCSHFGIKLLSWCAQTKLHQILSRFCPTLKVRVSRGRDQKRRRSDGE